MVFGDNFFAGSTVIINGRVINGGATGKLKKYDEKKSEEIGNLNKLTVESEVADVNIYTSKSSKVEAHLYGEASLDKDIKLDVQRRGNEVLVILRYSGNCYGGKLILDVTVPCKTLKEIVTKSSSGDVTLNEGIFAQNVKVHTSSGDVNLNAGIWTKNVKVHTSSGDITLDEDVTSEYVELKTSSGDIETDATFVTANISSTSGDVKLYILAKSNIKLDISATSGDISAEFDNIGHMNVSTRAMSGDVKNRHKRCNSGYTANVEISTMSGNIKIR